MFRDGKGLRKECLAEFSRGYGEVSSGDEGDKRAQGWLGSLKARSLNCALRGSGSP